MAIIDYLPLNLAFGLQSAPTYPDAVVKLDDIEKSLNLYLHALRRSCEQKVVAAEKKRRLPETLSSRRHVNALVWHETGNAHLPESIQRFDDAGLNRDLYYWLAAYIAFDRAKQRKELGQETELRVLELETEYQRVRG